MCVHVPVSVCESESVCKREREREREECVSPQNTRSVSSVVANVLDAQPVLVAANHG